MKGCRASFNLQTRAMDKLLILISIIWTVLTWTDLSDARRSTTLYRASVTNKGSGETNIVAVAVGCSVGGLVLIVIGVFLINKYWCNAENGCDIRKSCCKGRKIETSQIQPHNQELANQARMRRKQNEKILIQGHSNTHIISSDLDFPNSAIHSSDKSKELPPLRGTFGNMPGINGIDENRQTNEPGTMPESTDIYPPPPPAEYVPTTNVGEMPPPPSYEDTVNN